eukprot:12837569-Ditylum_brightwellii.AAC.1
MVVHVIKREDTVSAIDWLTCPSAQIDEFHDDERPESSEKYSDGRRSSSAFLLAVGGFEGTLSLYSIDPKFVEEKGVEILHEVKVESEIRSMSFVPHLQLSRSFAHVVVGEKNGRVSLCTIHGIDQASETLFHNTICSVDEHNSSVLTLAVNNDGTMLATGTKEGVLRVHRIQEEGGSAVLGHNIFETRNN